MIKRILKIALLTFVPVMWWVYQAVGYGLCWLGTGLQFIAVGLFNLLFVIPEQTTCQLFAQALHWELPVWQYVPYPTSADPSAVWIMGAAFAIWLIAVLLTWFSD